MMKPGSKVRILYPAYAAGKTGIILEQETLQNGSQTEYWLVQVEDTDEVLALLPEEMVLL